MEPDPPAPRGGPGCELHGVVRAFQGSHPPVAALRRCRSAEPSRTRHPVPQPSARADDATRVPSRRVVRRLRRPVRHELRAAPTRTGRVVATVHDLAFRRFPETAPQAVTWWRDAVL